jgi:hypothetical protein
MKQIKSTKIILEKKNKKNHKKGEKTMWGNTVANPQCFFKKTTKLNSEPAPYFKNKINKNNSEKKTQKNEKKRQF